MISKGQKVNISKDLEQKLAFSRDLWAVPGTPQARSGDCGFFNISLIKEMLSRYEIM